MKTSKCIVCASNIENLVCLGNQALANSNKHEIVNQDKYNLEIARCENCGHIQLNELVDPELLFREYIWVTGTSIAAQKFSKEFFDIVFSRSNTLNNVLEIASNDGTFLKPFKEHNIEVLGVDPAENLAQIANKNGIHTLPKFFNNDIINILKEYQLSQQYDAIIARNVIAHTPDPVGMLRNIEKCLTNGGKAFIEYHDAYHILTSFQYDSIYHEHYSYFNLSSFEMAAKMAGLYITDYIDSPISGGASIIVLEKEIKKQSESTIEKKQKDLKSGVNSLDAWKEFSHKVVQHANNFRLEIKKAKLNGPVYGYGSSARSNTLLSFCEINSDDLVAIVDNNPLKQGTYTPGTNIPIIGIDQMPKKNITIVILAWNFAKEIQSSLREQGLENINIIRPLPYNVTSEKL